MLKRKLNVRENKNNLIKKLLECIKVIREQATTVTTDLGA